MSALPITFDTLRRDKLVKGFPFQVAEYLHRFTRRCYDESFLATATIARHFEVDARTVQRALKRLSLAGYLVVIRDHTLKSRHRIRMFWRAAVATVFPSIRPAAPEPCVASNASENGNIVAGPTANVSPCDAFPPDPPIKVSEDGSMGGKTDCPGAGDPACGHPVPTEIESSSLTLRSLPPEEEEPEPEAIAAAVQEAAPVLGTGPAVEGRVRTWARQWGLPTLRKALGVAAETVRKGKLRSTPSGLIVGTMKRIEAEGGILPDVPAPARIATPTAEEKARVQARMAARRQGRGTSS